MAELWGAEMPDLPTWGTIGIGTGKLVYVFAILIFFIVAAVVFYLIYQWRLYNKKVVVFENISGQGFQPVFKDVARTIKLGAGGEEILYLRKKKCYRTAYGRKMGKNTYWFAIGQDGYWYNCVLGDIDAKMGMLDIEPIDRDMRYMHVAVRKNIADRYKKSKFLDKYAPILMNGMFLIIILIGIWFLLDKIATIASSSASSVEAANKVLAASKEVIVSLDNICTGGSGVAPG